MQNTITRAERRGFTVLLPVPADTVLVCSKCCKEPKDYEHPLLCMGTFTGKSQVTNLVRHLASHEEYTVRYWRRKCRSLLHRQLQVPAKSSGTARWRVRCPGANTSRGSSCGLCTQKTRPKGPTTKYANRAGRSTPHKEEKRPEQSQNKSNRVR